MNLLSNRWEELKAKPWPEFFAGLQAYLKEKATVRRVKVGNVVLCSLYISIDEWSVWLE